MEWFVKFCQHGSPLNLAFRNFIKLLLYFCGDIYPEQSPRQVALYNGEQTTFKAPWGEDMIIKSGDYLVKDPANAGYYRIAKVEFEKTYNV